MQTILPKKLFPFIWHFLREYKFAVSAFILLATAAGCWGPLNSILVKHLINLLPTLKGSSDISALTLPASLIVINFIIFDNITWRGLTYIRAKITPVIITRITGDLLNYALGKSHQFYQDNLSGKCAKQITNLTDGIEKLTTNIAANFLRGGSLLVTAFIAAFFVNPIFCSILVGWFIFFSGSSIYLSQKLVSLSDKQAEAESTVVGELVDSLSNHSNIRIFSRNAFERNRMSPYFSEQQKSYSAVFLFSMFMHTIQGGLIAIMMACSCYYLIHLYSQNLVTIGDFALILGLSMETGHMMWYTMSEVDEFNKAVGRCKQSLNALTVDLEIKDKPNAPHLKCTYGRIKFDNVRFHYQGTEPLFQNKNIEIKAGEKVGLVGYSGGGKSTFVNLILRLYDVNHGAILIDGQDICDVTQNSLRESIALIPQDPILFHRSLMENIRYGKIDATDEDIIEASKKAHAHDFISKLPQGYDSLVGERGIKLSGGQRQRIAIARAILKNAPILILDEATSQLDSITESNIEDSLSVLMQNKTTIIIAHRLSTLLHVDRILVFDQGKIVEDGPHAQLLAHNGLYKTLWDAQVGGFLPDKINEIY